jgi:hypothetical protein
MAFWFDKMQAAIQDKVKHHSRGLYTVLIFPIAFASLLTFIGARIVSLTIPQVGLFLAEDLRVHHFAYGFLIVAAAGYLALIFSGPRAKFLIALLFGFGLGLVFDEFAMWLKLRGDDMARNEYDGVVILISFFLLTLTVQPGMRFLLHHWPFSRKKLAEEHKILEHAGHKASGKNHANRKTGKRKVL